MITSSAETQRRPSRNPLLSTPSGPRAATHVLVTGRTGSGKTNFVLWWILNWIQRGLGWLTYSDPHRENGEYLLSQLLGKFGRRWFQRYVRVIDVNDFSRVCMQRFLWWSEADDPFIRAKENEMFRRQHVERLLRTRGQTDFGERVGTEQYVNKLIAIGQELKGAIPEHQLCLVLRHNTPQLQLALKQLKDTECGQWLEWFNTQRDKGTVAMAEAAIRLWEAFFTDPAIRARTSRPPTFDREAFLNDGGTTVILGERGLESALGNIVGTEFHAAADLASRRRIIPGMYWLDEVFNVPQFGPHEARGLATLRTFGMGIGLIAQTLPVEEYQLLTDILQNTDHYHFSQNDPKSADIIAASLRSTLNPMKVHHQVEKQRHGGFRETPRISRSMSLTQPERITHTDTTQLVPTYDFYHEDVYQSLSEQTIELAGRIQSLAVGECFANERRHGISLRRIPLVEDTWQFPGLAQQKVTECLALLRERPEMEEPLWVETTTPSQPSEMQKSTSSSKSTKSSRHGSSRSSRSSRMKRAGSAGSNGSANGKN